MQANMMQTGYMPTDAAQVIAMSSHRDSKVEIVPYASSNDHLEALEYEAKLMVAVAAYRTGPVADNDDGPDREVRFSFLPSGITLQQVQCLHQATAAENRQREEVSRHHGVQLNFIDFCNKRELDGAERQIVMLLLMQFSSPAFCSVYQASRLERHCDNGMEIGALLTIISENLGQQLDNRRYFSIHSTLMNSEIIRSDYTCVDSTTSILRMSVYLHERYVRHILGDQNQYHAAFRFIRQERSTVKLSHVVLPDSVKQDVISTAEHYLAGRKNGSLDRMDEFFGYGTGLTFLFHGPSGTGKTMLAKGLANYLNCPLVSLNLEDMPKIQMSDEDILAMLFREATLLGGIVFLDECDDIFGRSETRLSRSLLLEIEKSRCITIMATNKPLELDPAMERRLAMKVKFELPDVQLRELMWRSLLPPEVTLAPDVNLQALAERFQFSGGLIKNSILLAVTSLPSVSDGTILLKQEALERAATLQTATMNDMSRLCETLPPLPSLEVVPVSRQQRDQLHGLAQAWQWLRREETGFNLLFNCSDITTGIKAAYGLAAEIGMDVQAFDIARVSSVAEDDKVLDMVSQRRMYPMVAAFLNSSACRTMTLFIDYNGDVARLIDSGYDKATNLMYGEMFHQLRKNKGLFCLVTRDVKSGLVPVEFHQMITLAHPPEELQMRHWEENIGCGSISDDDLVDLVERYPMHLSEIGFISRQAKVRAIISGRDHTGINDVRDVISGYRGIKKAGVLFGRDT